MKIICKSVIVLLWFFLLHNNSFSQEQYGSFINVKDFFFSDSLIGRSDEITGFTFGNGYLWGITASRSLVKIDTADFTGAAWKETVITDWYSGSYYGGIVFDRDTIWIYDKNSIIPIDTSGNQIGERIDLSHLPAPYKGAETYGLIKDKSKFWILRSNLIYCLDRTGKLLKPFSNSWFAGTSFMLYDKYLIINSGQVPPSNDEDYDIVNAIDTVTGEIVNYWEYPDRYASNPSYLRLIGLTNDGGNIWSIEREWSPVLGYTVRKLTIPPLTTFPAFNYKHWGDFEIEDWKYCPKTGGSIEGIYGLYFDTVNNSLWIGEGIGHILGYKSNETKSFTPLGEWGDYFTIPRDICFINDTMWVVQYWPGLRKGMVSQLVLGDNGNIKPHIHDFDVGLDQMDGIATDGENIWVSGRESAQSTGMHSNEIKKLDKQGNVLNHFVFSDDLEHDYEDLTWFQNYLWAISSTGSKAQIHKIDPNTGELLHTFETGWIGPMVYSNIQCNLASDGENLIVINGCDSTGISNIQIFSFEDSHPLLLKLKVISPPDIPLLENPSNGSVNLQTSLTLIWNTVENTENFELQVDDNNDFISPVFNQSGIAGASQQITGLDNNTTYYWRVRASNAGGPGVWSETWNFTTINAAGINNVNSKAEFRFSPNPVKNVLLLEGIENENTNVSILSIDGKLIKQITDLGINQIDLSDLQKGIYLLKILNSKTSITRKIIKQ